MALTVKKDPGSGASPITSDCLVTDVVGNFVYITGDRIESALQIETVNIEDLAKMPAIGIITEKLSSTKCRLQTSGIVEGVLSGLTPQERYYIGTDGKATATPPEPGAGETFYIQYVGIAIASNALYLDIAKVPIKRSN